ncbi:MAG: maleylacetate reductase, partial [Gammaproteobacteria bacterium]
MQSFEMKMLPWNVAFGCGVLSTLPVRLDALGFKRAFAVGTSDRQAGIGQLGALLGKRIAGQFPRARMHVPMEIVAEARQLAEAAHADCTIAIGGGSATGLGKALALHADLPLIAIPTTYAGSEMTNIWGVTEDGRKRTGRDPKVLPVLTLYDPELTLGLPRTVTGPSAMNALAQAVVNAHDRRANPITHRLALDAVQALAAALPEVFADEQNLAARERLLYGACLAGAALGAGVTSLHHRLCHTLGGSYGTPHAETHTVLLPYTVAYAAPAVPDLMQAIAIALNAQRAASGIFDLAVHLG